MKAEYLQCVNAVSVSVFTETIKDLYAEESESSSCKARADDYSSCKEREDDSSSCKARADDSFIIQKPVIRAKLEARTDSVQVAHSCTHTH